MSKPVKDKVAAAKRLIETCDSCLLEPKDLYKVRGISDVSRDDLEVIKDYCGYYIENKTIGGYMPPRGKVGSVLRKIGIA